jgi:hypothetical protein
MQCVAKITKNGTLSAEKRTELIVMQKKKANYPRKDGMRRATKACKTLNLRVRKKKLKL